MIVAGIPLFAFTFCAFAYLLPGDFGFLQWLAASAVAVIAAQGGVLLIERFAFTFAPAGDA
jgi:hypothetical protein